MHTITHNKSSELKKHIGLIHSTNKLSLLERKIANALLFNAYENLATQSEHQIHIPSLCVLIGYNSKDDKTIKRALKSLISTVLEWNILDKNKESESTWVASTMLSDAKIESTICTYSYSNRMRELCYYPEFYGRLNMQILARFKSSYGLALYENCIRYQNINQTPWFDILTYRRLMGISNIQYPIFRDMNKRVLKPSVKEVNDYSPIFIKPEIKKEGKKVVAIRFQISKQIKADNKEKSQNTGDESLADKLVNAYGLSLTKTNIILGKFDKEYILEKMKLIESSSSYQNGKINNLAKYFEKALLENYQPPKSSYDNIAQLRLQQEKEIFCKKEQEENLYKYRYYQSSELPKILLTLPKEQRSAIEKEFDSFIQPTVHYNLYVREGLNNPLVKDRFADFIRSRYTDILKLLLTFQEFSEGIKNGQ